MKPLPISDCRLPIAPLLTICVICAICGHAAAYTVVFDAAEQYLDGTPLCTDGTFVATRLCVDNRPGAGGASAASDPEDLTGLRWTMGYTGTLWAVLPWSTADATNPWTGVPLAPAIQELGGFFYGAGIADYSDGTWGPYWQVKNADGDTVDQLWDVVPAGLVWDRVYKLEGIDMALFHSPASGDLAAGGGSTTYYDSDPTPQTAPEPATLALLVTGCVGLLRRSRRRRL